MRTANIDEWSATIGHRRRPRAARPVVPVSDLQIAPPPELARAVPQSLLLRLLPAVMVVAVIGANVT
ncbi:hypothetical protein WKY82_10290 [Gordonia malaquae]|uniref:hypothetical protein n=1 Tax=Gordonia malaquae TaxID=410332 RepID=UPI0030C793DC